VATVLAWERIWKRYYYEFVMALTVRNGHANIWGKFSNNHLMGLITAPKKYAQLLVFLPHNKTIKGTVSQKVGEIRVWSGSIGPN
jgi:hypothetical protein